MLYNVASSPRTRKFLLPVFIAADTFSDTLSEAKRGCLIGIVGIAGIGLATLGTSNAVVLTVPEIGLFTDRGGSAKVRV